MNLHLAAQNPAIVKELTDLLNKIKEKNPNTNCR
jgi:hypothetical protein